MSDRNPAQLTPEQILAGAKFYARAYLSRAFCGIIPQWDADADEDVWQKTTQERRDEYLDMVRGITVAACFGASQDLAAVRAIEILDTAESPGHRGLAALPLPGSAEYERAETQSRAIRAR